MAESFFATLKGELCDHVTFSSHTQTRDAIFEYIEVFHNRQRLHFTLDCKSPSEYEKLYRRTALVT